MRRRAAVEPVIDHLKAEHRMGRNYLKGRDGDRMNAVLAAAGYNFGLLLRWLAELLRALIRALVRPPSWAKSPNPTSTRVLHELLRTFQSLARYGMVCEESAESGRSRVAASTRG